MLKYERIILLFLLLSVCLNNKINIIDGEIIDSQLMPVVMTDLNDGLDTDTSADKLLPSQSPYLYNVDFDETNSLSTRLGTSLKYTLPVATTTLIKGGFVATYDDGSSEFIVQAGSIVFVTTGDDVWTTIAEGVSTLYPMSYVLHYKRVFMSNGVDNVGVWDRYTNTFSTYSFIPKGRYLISDKCQLLIAGTFENPANIYFSEIESEGLLQDDWPSYHWIECGKGDGQVITGLFNQDGRIYIPKTNSTYGLLTDASYRKAERILYSDLYGCVSNNSINNWKTGKILLNRFGLYFYDGGREWEFIGRNIKKNLTDKIGLLSSTEGRWTTTSNTDFSTGTFSNCFNNNGTVAVTTATKVWESNADFNTAYTGSTQQSIKDNTISISTYSGAGSGDEIKVPLTFYDTSPKGALFEPTDIYVSYLKATAWSQTTPSIVNFTNRPANWVWATDNDPESFAILNGDSPNGNQAIDVRFAINGAVATQISRLELTYMFGVTTSRWGVGKANVFIDNYIRLTQVNNSYIKTEKKAGSPYYNYGELSVSQATESSPFWITNGLTGGINLTFDGYKHMPIKQTKTVNIKADYNSIYTDTVDDKGKPEIIRVGFTFIGNPFSDNTGKSRTGNIDFWFNGAKGIALKIYDISAWKINSVNSVWYSSAIYISPIYDTAYSSPAYIGLYPESNYLNSSNSSGTISYATRTSTASNMGNPTNWYGLGVSSITNTAIDGNRYFQWKAELWTSTPTVFTPIISRAELRFNPYGYGTYISTYTSKVYNVGQDLTSWGSFVSDTDGTVAFRIRSATWSFTSDFSESVIAWGDITSGSDISISTNNTYVQWQGRISSKDGTINGVTLSWKTGGGGGGTQDVASINHQDKYYLSYSTWSTHNTDVLIFDKNGKFTRYDWDVVGFADFNNKLYILSATMPYIYQALTGATDNGSPINFVYETGNMNFGNADRKKEIINIYLTGKKLTDSWVRLKTYVNGSTTTTDNFYCGLGNTNNFKLNCSDATYGKNIKYIINSTSTVNVEINGLNSYIILKDLQ